MQSAEGGENAMPSSELTQKLSVHRYSPSHSNAQLLFIEAAITGMEYAEEGFQSLQGWDISLKITDEGERY